MHEICHINATLFNRLLSRLLLLEALLVAQGAKVGLQEMHHG